MNLSAAILGNSDVASTVCAVSQSWQRAYGGELRRLLGDVKFVNDGSALANCLASEWTIATVVLDLSLATPALTTRFSLGGPRLIVFGSADHAGFALGARDVTFIDEGDIVSLLAALDRPEPRPDGFADLSDRTNARRGALDAETASVAAALARLARPGQGDGASRVEATTVRAMIRARRARDRFFPAEIFGDPAWDMLLDLFAAQIEGTEVSVSSLCIAAAVPTTTALRWIRNLCEAGLFDRTPDPADARRAFITLAGTTAAAMHAYFAAIDGVGSI